MSLTKEEIVNIIANFCPTRDEIIMSSFILKKSKKQNLEEKFTVLKLPIFDPSLEQAFLNFLDSTFQRMPKEVRQYKMFQDPENTNEFLIIKKDMLPELSALIDTMETNDDIRSIETFKAVGAKSKVYCIKVKTDNTYVIIFAYLDTIHTDNSDIISSDLKNNKLHLKTTESIIFKNSSFAVYYDRAKCLLMLNYDATKELLDFKTQFTIKCQEVIKNLENEGILEIGDDLSKLVNNQTTNEMILKISNAGRLKPDANHIQRWNDFCNNTPLEGVDPVILNNNDIPLIKKATELANFAHVADNDIVEGVIRRGEYSLVYSRKILQTRQRT